MTETLGNRLSKILEQNGMKQKELADEIGTTEVTIHRYIKDKRVPRADTIVNIAKALHTTTDELLGLEKEQTNEEWLKSMNTEQLAEWLFEHADCMRCECNKNICHDGYDCCKLAFWEWLKEVHK